MAERGRVEGQLARRVDTVLGRVEAEWKARRLQAEILRFEF